MVNFRTPLRGKVQSRRVLFVFRRACILLPARRLLIIRNCYCKHLPYEGLRAVEDCFELYGAFFEEELKVQGNIY